MTVLNQARKHPRLGLVPADPGRHKDGPFAAPTKGSVIAKAFRSEGGEQADAGAHAARRTGLHTAAGAQLRGAQRSLSAVPSQRSCAGAVAAAPHLPKSRCYRSGAALECRQALERMSAAAASGVACTSRSRAHDDRSQNWRECARAASSEPRTHLELQGGLGSRLRGSDVSGWAGARHHHSPYRPITEIEHTFWCGKPPRLCVRP